ncbi:MAG: homocysteine S-methyltransferase family protein [Clostridia bacterium]
MANKFSQLLNKKIVVLDGAMATMLALRGLSINKNTELLSLTNPDIVEDVHYRYLMAGADIIYTNTFGANPKKLIGYDLKSVISASIACAKNAVERANRGLICFDMSTLGELLEPMGKLSFDEAYNAYREVVLLAKDKVDMFVVETMSDLYELKCAVLAIKENCDLPVIVSMSFDTSGHTFAGCAIEAMIATMTGLNVDALGLNCSLSPTEIAPLVKRFLALSNLPILIKPNAGLPTISSGTPTYSTDAKDFADTMLQYVKLGINIVGGCCGTTDDYIRELSLKVNELKPTKILKNNFTLVSSGAKCVNINQPRIVGERINPTGKKLMKEAILNCDISYFQKQAVEQAEKGAEILDINVGVPNINESEMMKLAVQSVQAIVDLPLQIDSSDIASIETGLRYYNGKPLLNSVNGDDEVLNSILPLAKKYGACVVGLTLDKRGIPQTVDERLNIARKIVDCAIKFGISKNDIVIDCLTLTLGAEQFQAQNTLEAITRVKNELGVKTMLGVSNISFGLPERQAINSSFLLMALAHGLDLAIINPNLESMEQSFLCYRIISGHDIGCQKFISRYANSSSSSTQASASEMTLNDCIILGLSKVAETLTTELLKTNDGLKILDTYVIPSLDIIGEQYETGKIFLPQLLRSSEVAKNVCNLIKESLPANNSSIKSTVILATVQGDIHDIGKNIVKTVLENYGYNVVDLGKDVAIEVVVKSVLELCPKVVGLSALMTTTVSNMKDTIYAIRKSGSHVKICVGGAVLSQSIANEIGADCYCKDPRQLIKFLESL